MPSRRTFLVSSLAFAVIPPAAAAVVGADLEPANGDRTEAFRAGLAKAVAEKRPFVLAPGVYRIGAIEIPDGAQIHGTAGMTTLIAACDGSFMTARNAKRIVLSGLAFDGQNRKGDPTAAILVLTDVADLRLVDCVVGRGSGMGVYLERCGGRIEKCTIASIGSYGILARDSRALTIADNTVADCGEGGILVHRGAPGEDGSVVRGNRVERIRATSGGTGQVGNGINIHRAHDVAIVDNRITDCAFSGIRVNSGSNARIIGNEIQRSGETALYVEFEFQGAVIANNLIDGAANGISVVNFNDGGRLATVTGNVVRNLRPSPATDPNFPSFGLAVEADTTVTGNVVEEGAQIGMLVGWGEYLRNVTITGNVVRKVGVGIAVTVQERAGTTVIASNIFQATEKGAIVGYHHTRPVTGDLVAADRGIPAHLRIEGNRASR
ncbi:TIGR03808 family TAT-translocated repetitive protein [Pinisolibacter sp.]|uniref:TIGR03808 family TAT-translocated repetitive protein n=1 Tax=Pinisolibacter sp. TaxID=2172024 RepID=UPI002FDD91B1